MIFYRICWGGRRRVNKGIIQQKFQVVMEIAWWFHAYAEFDRQITFLKPVPDA